MTLRWASARAITASKKILLELNPFLQANSEQNRAEQIRIELVAPVALDENMLMSIQSIRKGHYLCSRLFFMQSEWIGADDTVHTPPPADGNRIPPPLHASERTLDPITHLQLHSPQQSALYFSVHSLLESLAEGNPPAAFVNSPSAEPIRQLHGSLEDLERCARLFEWHRSEILEILAEKFGAHEMTSRKIGEQVQWMENIMQNTDRIG